MKRFISVIIDIIMYTTIFQILATTGLIFFSWQYWVLGALLVLFKMKGYIEHDLGL